MKDPNKINKILTIKERIRKAYKERLATATRAVRKAEIDAVQANKTYEIAMNEVTQIGEVTAEELAWRAAAVSDAKRQAQGAHSILEQCSNEHDQKRHDLIEVNRDVRTLEILQKRSRVVEDKKRRDREQVQNDESVLKNRTTK